MIFDGTRKYRPKMQSENYMSYVKKSQLFKKYIKLRIEVAEDLQKHILKSIFDFE